MLPSEEHKQRKFQYGNPYADYEYYNKRSRKTGPGLVLAILFGLGMILLGWMRLRYLGEVEQTGDTISMTSLEWGLYKLGGKWAIAGVLFALGLFFFYGGIKNYRRLEKMKQGA